LHAPLGEIPPDAIHPSTGPSPEELLQRKARDRGARKQKHLKGPMSSTESSLYSGQGSVPNSLNIFSYTGSGS
jgi:hypothetical protein